MFSTEHLVGRLRYETDKVVCIDVYARTDLILINLDLKEGDFITQVLLSLVNKQYRLTFSNELYLNLSSAISNNLYEYGASCQSALYKELDEGINSYLKVRKELELD